MAVPELDLRTGKFSIPAAQILKGLPRFHNVSLRNLLFRYLLDKPFSTEPLLA